jgi:hypothetical protein
VSVIGPARLAEVVRGLDTAGSGVAGHQALMPRRTSCGHGPMLTLPLRFHSYPTLAQVHPHNAKESTQPARMHGRFHDLWSIPRVPEIIFGLSFNSIRRLSSQQQSNTGGVRHESLKSTPSIALLAMCTQELNQLTMIIIARNEYRGQKQPTTAI